jgi:cytidylate kinase
MPVVAITREMGSLGKDVAQGLSERLGVPLIYHEVIDHLADRMRVRKSHVVRMLDGSAGLLERLTADKTSLSIFSADEIVNLALQGSGAVIRGWGATHILREVPHAVCVRVCAPFEQRKQRMMARLGTQDADKVSEEIRNNDEARDAAALAAYARLARVGECAARQRQHRRRGGQHRAARRGGRGGRRGDGGSRHRQPPAHRRRGAPAVSLGDAAQVRRA